MKKESSKNKNLTKILFVAAEVNPFSQTGGLGEVASSLPIALNAKGLAEVAVISPLYEVIGKEMRSKFDFITSTYIQLSWRKQYVGLFRYKTRGVTYYFLDNEYYFKRRGLYGHYDDGERFAFFSKAVLDIIPLLDFSPDIIHSNDWHTALVPIYYKLGYVDKPLYRGIKNVFTIHNIEYQGIFGREILGDVFGLADYVFPKMSWMGSVNLVAGAIRCADIVSTVSETYAKEILRPEYACGLDPLLNDYSSKVMGIVNGIDVEVYNPESGADLFAPYSAEDLSGKWKNKAELQKLLQLPEKKDVPLITMVSRLAAHKGLDILKEAMYDLVSDDIQLVVLGTGAPEYEGFFLDMERAHPDKIRAVIAFDKSLSRKLFAAGDIYMMPSKSEPCGLGQMMAMRYGTLPIVRSVGGLNDTVKDGVNGFVCPEHYGRMLAETTRRAEKEFADREKWLAMVKTAMTTDWSWNVSAEKYAEMYKKCLATG